jgi:hypothetical protein
LSPLEAIVLPAPTKSQIKRKPVGGLKRISPPNFSGKIGNGKAKRVDSLGLLDEEEDRDLQENEYDLSAGRIPSDNESPYLEDYGPEYSRGYEDTDGFFQARPHSFDLGKQTYPKTEWPW